MHILESFTAREMIGCTACWDGCWPRMISNTIHVTVNQSA